MMIWIQKISMLSHHKINTLLKCKQRDGTQLINNF